MSDKSIPIEVLRELSGIATEAAASVGGYIWHNVATSHASHLVPALVSNGRQTLTLCGLRRTKQFTRNLQARCQGCLALLNDAASNPAPERTEIPSQPQGANEQSP